MAFKIKKVKPLFTGVITTSRTFVGDQHANKNGLILDTTKMAGTMNPIQQVYAAGPQATGVKEGDVVKLNFKRYMKTKQTPGAIENNVQSSNLQAYYEFPVIEIDGVKYLYMQNNDIEYVIEEYEVDEGGLFE